MSGYELDWMQCVSESLCFEDPLPRLGGLRRPPAEVANGRGGEGNAFVGDDLIVGGGSALEFAVGGLKGCRRGGEGEQEESGGEGLAHGKFTVSRDCGKQFTGDVCVALLYAGGYEYDDECCCSCAAGG